jgi:hypothetical protein
MAVLSPSDGVARPCMYKHANRNRDSAYIRRISNSNEPFTLQTFPLTKARIMFINTLQRYKNMGSEITILPAVPGLTIIRDRFSQPNSTKIVYIIDHEVSSHLVAVFFGCRRCQVTASEALSHPYTPICAYRFRAPITSLVYLVYSNASHNVVDSHVQRYFTRSRNWTAIGQ